MEDTTERCEETTATSVKRCWVLRSALPGDDTFLHLRGSSWALGRADQADWRIARERVSRLHAEVQRRGPLLSIHDLGSTNGTYVDGVRVAQKTLGVGAVVRLGEWLGVVEETHVGDGSQEFVEAAPGVWGGPILSRSIQSLAPLAGSVVPVLLVGRTGTGKERFAHALHSLGGADRPFHAINCATLPETIADAELFGYRKGAFTGADRTFTGRLRAAHGGTLFLDEVVDLPASTQAKLLRALDTYEVTPLGETSTTRFDARIVAACQRPISEYVGSGRFREDLAARLCGAVVTLPDLKLRRADIPKLFDMFLRQYSGGTAPRVSTRLYERLCLHDWPGNVRELQLLARRLLAMNGLEPKLGCSHLPDGFASVQGEATPRQASPALASVRHERDVKNLAAALRGLGGNVRKAAEAVGISRQRAYRLIGSRRLGGLVSTSRHQSIGDDDEREF